MHEHKLSSRRRGNLLISLVDENKQSGIKQGIINILGTGKIGKLNVRLDATNKDGLFETTLPSGYYHIQAISYGYEVGREQAKIGRNAVTEVKISLKTRTARASLSFEDRLKKIGISPDKLEEFNGSYDLVVNRGEIVNINTRDDKNVQRTRVKTLEELKKHIGLPAEVFGGNYPRFGEIKDKDRLFKELRSIFAHQRPTIDSIPEEKFEAIRDIANEYIHGNSKSVEEFLPLLNTAFQVQYPDGLDVMAIPRRNVRIHMGAVLNLPADLTAFYVYKLSIHPQGKIRFHGSTRLDVVKYVIEEFQGPAESGG